MWGRCIASLVRCVDAVWWVGRAGCLSTAAIALLLSPCVGASDRPNVVVFMADDMGYADAGCTGATDIQTPHIDRLAGHGVLCRQGYANHPFCAPSRAAFLTGRYQQRFGFEDNPQYEPANHYLGVDPQEKLFPERLREVGYTTGVVGKWHLGAAAPFHPNLRGFDYFFGFLGGGHDYYEIDLLRPVGSGYFLPLVRNRGAVSFEGYLTTALSQDAADFVTRHAEAPFLLFVSYNAPHMPLQAPDEAIARYAHIAQRKRRIYAAMVDLMDQGIGTVVDALERAGVRENTLVFFLSDNGGPQPMNPGPHSWNGSSNAPLRGGKTTMYEGGIRVPFIASWPKVLPQGVQYDRPVIATDIARTAVEAAGADAQATPAMEGVNLIPYLSGKRCDPPHEALFWRNRDGAQWAVLGEDGRKLVQNTPADGPRLFDVPADVGEGTDLKAEREEDASRLRAAWEGWDADNVAGRIPMYLDYRRDREAFFRSSVPEAARAEGFPPPTD